MNIHKLRKLTVLFSLLISTFTLAQNITVSGIIAQTTNNTPVSNTHIVFTDIEKDDKTYEGISNEKGQFNLQIPSGFYIITIDKEGFESYFEQKYLTKDTVLENISLKPQDQKSKQIEAVVIQGTKPIYKIELDRKVYDVSQDITAKGGSLSDVMQNVPSVSVDVDGTVSLRGNENVTVLIDGKPSAMLGINSVGDALKMISADMVERIEVVTNASARYQASGTAGIINIITKKTRKSGLTGTVAVSGGSPQLYGTNVSLGYGKENWNWFANAGFRYSKSEGKNFNDYTGFASDGSIKSHSLQNSTRERENTSLNFNTGFNFNFDDYNSLTTSIGYRTSKANTHSITNYSDSTPRTEFQHNDGFGIDGNLNFTHNFLKKGNILTIDGNYNYTVDDSDSNIYDEIPEKSLNYNTRTGFMLKSDYVLPFKEGSQLEAGVRADYSKTKTDYSLNQFQSTNTWMLLPDYTDQTNYQENILSAYIQYGNKFGDFSFLAGLREETSYIKIESNKGAAINKNYTDLFPTLHLNYNITEKSQLQLSYSRRVNRPRSRMLIPYKNNSDDKNTFQGNIDLDPSYTDSYELGYNMQYRSWSITPSLYYQRTNDPFQMIITKDALDNLNTMPVNLGHENRYGGELSYSISPYKWWKIFGEVNLYQYENFGTNTYIDSYGNQKVQDLNKSGFSWTTRLNTSVKLPENFNLQVQGNYMAPRKSGQNKTKEMYGMNIGLSKDLFNDKATLLFNVQDVFNSRKRKVETFGEDFYRYSEMQWRPRQFTLSFTYRFNESLKNNKKKNTPNNNNNSSEMDDMIM